MKVEQSPDQFFFKKKGAQIGKDSDWTTGFFISWVSLDSVGHKVKIHKITPGTGKERGDIEKKDYVVLNPKVRTTVFLLLTH